MRLSFFLIILGIILLAGVHWSDQAKAARLRGKVSTVTPVHAAGRRAAIPSPTDTDIRLPILLYHHIAAHNPQNPYFVSRDNLDAHFQWLKDNSYTPVTIGHAADCLGGKCQLPAKAVVITFDDGWTDEYTNGFPLLKKYGFSATFYIKLNNYNGRGGITTEQLKEMTVAGIEVGSHTITHPDLRRKSDNQLVYELRESKKILEHDLGVPINSFAYPGGSFNDRVVAAVKAAGYRSATTTIHSIWQNSNDLFRLRRVHIDDDMDNLIARVEGRRP